MNRRMVYGLLAVAVTITVLGGLVPQVRHVAWSGLPWGIFALAVLLVLGVAGNILWAMWSMYRGYRVPDVKTQPSQAGPELPGTVLPFAPSCQKIEIIARADPEDILLELCRAECCLSNLETSVSFQAFTEEQKSRYSRALAELHALVRDVSQADTHDRVAS